MKWEFSNYRSPYVRVLSLLQQQSGKESIPVKHSTFCDALNNSHAYLHICIGTKHPEQDNAKYPLLLHVHERLKYVNSSEAVHLKHDLHLLILERELKYNKVLRHGSAPQKRKVILKVLHLLGICHSSLTQ